MNIFSKLADRLEELNKQIEDFFNEICTPRTNFEKLNTKQQQELISYIANTGGKFPDSFNSLWWGKGFEEAVFELQNAQNANKTDLTEDLKNRFKLLCRGIEGFFWPNSEKAVLDKIKSEEFTFIVFSMTIGDSLEQTIRQLRNISERAINVSLHPSAKVENVNKPQEKDGQGTLSKPMSKSKMMAALRIDSRKTFNTFAKSHGIKQAGNRQTFVIRLDTMDAHTRAKLEKA